MATATDNLEEEVHELERSEANLERRADSLALTNVLAFLFAFVALAVSIVAIVMAASDDNGGNGSMMNRNVNGSPGVTGGMMGSQTSGVNAAPAGVHTIDVKLGEMWVRPQYSSVAAGKVTFAAENTGQVEHELMVERMPLKMDAPGQPNEEAAQGMIEEMGPGQSGKMTLNLKPGSYVLFCNVTGHYAAGQHTPFTVTAN
jgi:uncharacterized cupredoxin-like copper-binding protein